jgi:hypothetical protein
MRNEANNWRPYEARNAGYAPHVRRALVQAACRQTLYGKRDRVRNSLELEQKAWNQDERAVGRLRGKTGHRLSLNRYAARRDDNEPEVVETLEKVGASVERLKWPCDLAVWFRYRQFLIEVHNPKSKYRKRSKKQLDVFAKLGIPMATCGDEALRIIGAL